LLPKIFSRISANNTTCLNTIHWKLYCIKNKYIYQKNGTIVTKHCNTYHVCHSLYNVHADHNLSQNRGQQIDAQGQGVYKTAYSKGTGKWVAKPCHSLSVC
jgi:hypothetical protein